MNIWDQLVDCICRPPRCASKQVRTCPAQQLGLPAGCWAQDATSNCTCTRRDVYSPAELLGGFNQTFMVGAMECTRLDYELVSSGCCFGSLTVHREPACNLQCRSQRATVVNSVQDKGWPGPHRCSLPVGMQQHQHAAAAHQLPCHVVSLDISSSVLRSSGPFYIVCTALYI